MARNILILLRHFAQGYRPGKRVSATAMQRLGNLLQAEATDRMLWKANHNDNTSKPHAYLALNKPELVFLESVVKEYNLPQSSPNLLKRIQLEKDSLTGFVFEEDEINPKRRPAVEFEA